jgi:hypothetical protein
MFFALLFAIIESNTATHATLTASTHSPGDDVTSQVPAALLVKQTFLIWSEVSYLYTPAVGYVTVKTGVTLSDFAYSRPRQFSCLTYNSGIPVITPHPLARRPDTDRVLSANSKRPRSERGLF